MTDDVLKHALLPFFSTKEKGTGLGLALCREIVDAHRGKLRLARRDGGGIAVTCWLPGRRSAPALRSARLTLTRG
jgi:signal transduction histidine kinase